VPVRKAHPKKNRLAFIPEDRWVLLMHPRRAITVVKKTFHMHL
jgi:hypothetical protein